MRNLVRVLVALAGVGLAVGGGYLYAQPGEEDDDTEDERSLFEDEEKLSPEEMMKRANKYIDEMKKMLKRMHALQGAARKQKDIIKLNCVNDKLIQLKQLLNIADEARNDMTEAITLEKEEERYHQFGQIKLAHEKAMALRDEAEACIGEELVFLGPTEVDTEAPDVGDDPTEDDPFDYTDPEIERPGYASPFL